MELHPILSAMRRNKVGAILIGVQMAITLAILCNALFIIEQRLALSKRPTGTDEAMSSRSPINGWAIRPTIAANCNGILAALRVDSGRRRCGRQQFVPVAATAARPRASSSIRIKRTIRR